MKVKSGLILLLLLFSMGSASLAATKTTKSITINERVMVAGTELQPGRYQVVWDGTGPEVQVSFMRGNKTIASGPARLVMEPSRYDGAVEFKTTDDNAKLLESIVWKKKALMFAQSDVGAGN